VIQLPKLNEFTIKVSCKAWRSGYSPTYKVKAYTETEALIKLAKKAIKSADESGEYRSIGLN
jgi:hypothetical protein